MKSLVARHADINNPFGINGETPLMTAASSQNPEILSLLIENGVNFLDVDTDGRNALMVGYQVWSN